MVGAGSMRAANYLYVDAPKDGTTFGVFGSDLAMIGVVGANRAVQFDPRKFTWLGSSSSFANDAYMLIVRADAQLRSIADARRRAARPSCSAAPGKAPATATCPRFPRRARAQHQAGAGYTDSPAIFLAVERGEVDGRTFDFSAVKAARPQWLKPESGFTFWSSSRARPATRISHVPTAREFATEADARALIEFSEIPLLTMARPFAAPPGVPDARARALQVAFLAVHRDARFLDEAEKLGIDISPVGADQVARGVERLAQAPPAVFDYLRRLLARH